MKIEMKKLIAKIDEKNSWGKNELKALLLDLMAEQAVITEAAK